MLLCSINRYMNSQNSVCYRIRITFVRSNTSSNHIKQHGRGGTGTFREQDLSFPRTNSPYGELSFPRTFESSLELSKVPWNFRSRALSFSGTFIPGEQKLSFPGPFVPRNFRSQDFSFQLFYKALAMNTDSYSNCQNLFHSRPSSVLFLTQLTQQGSRESPVTDGGSNSL